MRAEIVTKKFFKCPICGDPGFQMGHLENSFKSNWNEGVAFDGFSIACRHSNVCLMYRHSPFSKKLWLAVKSGNGVEIYLFLNKESDTWIRQVPVVFAGALYSG